MNLDIYNDSLITLKKNQIKHIVLIIQNDLRSAGTYYVIQVTLK